MGVKARARARPGRARRAAGAAQAQPEAETRTHRSRRRTLLLLPNRSRPGAVSSLDVPNLQEPLSICAHVWFLYSFNGTVHSAGNNHALM